MACETERASDSGSATPWLELGGETALLEDGELASSSSSSSPSRTGETTVSGPSASVSISWGAAVLVAALLLGVYWISEWR